MGLGLATIVMDSLILADLTTSAAVLRRFAIAKLVIGIATTLVSFFALAVMCGTRSHVYAAMPQRDYEMA